MNKKELFDIGLEIREKSRAIDDAGDKNNFTPTNRLKEQIKELVINFQREAYLLYKSRYEQYPYAFIGIESEYIYYKYIEKGVILIDFGIGETVPYDYREYKSIDEMFNPLSKIKATKSGRIIQKDIACFVERLSGLILRTLL